VIVRLTLREPQRGAAERKQIDVAAAPPVRDVIRTLWSRRSFRWLSVGAGFQAFAGYGSGAWIAAMFERTHHLTTTEIGLALFWLGIPAAIGTFAGGWMGDRFGARDVRWYVWLPAGFTLLSVPFSAYGYLTGDPWLAFWVFAIPNLLGAYWLAPTFSLTQGLVGVRMRALAASFVLFVLNIIGLGLGPQFVGAFADLLNTTTNLGIESLRWSLVASLLFAVAATVCYLRAGVSLKADLARAHET
jgi:MFS family permease